MKTKLQYKENCFYLFTMSVPVPSNTKTDFRSAIVSSIFLEDFKIGKYEFLRRMLDLNLRKVNLVYISERVEGFISTTSTSSYNLKLKIDYVNLNFFFSFDGLEVYFNKRKNENYETVYCIEGCSWLKICALFATSMIDISGGSNNKKHMLSPHQHRLSQFLSCLYGNESSSIINESFHRAEKDKKSLEYSTKSIQNDIINFAESNEILRAKLIKSKNDLEKSNVVLDLDDQSTYTSSLNDVSVNNDQTSLTYSNSNSNFNSTQSTSSPTVNEASINNINKNNIDNRKFHTSAYLLNSKITEGNDQIKDILVAPQPSILNKELDKIILKKTNIENYLESIKEIILEVEADIDNEIKRQEIQEKFENTWINLIEENLKNDKILINKYQNKFFSVISEAAITLDSMNENKYLKKKFPQLGDELNKKEYLILTFSICISLYSRLSYNSLAIKIGEEIVYFIYKNKFIKNKKLNTDKSGEFISFDEYKQLLNIDKTFYVKLGDFFMTILQTFPHDLFNRVITLNSYFSKEPLLLEMNMEYLEDIKNNLILNPSTLPMICRPMEWTDKNYGGYLSNKIKHNDIVTSSGDLSHKIENKDSIYKAVNYLNSIKFAVNKNLLDYLLSSEGSYILETIKPEDELQRELTLFIANFYKNVYFYLNTHTDWRGRIYTQSFYLSYQAGDLSSALLNFWEGEPINEIGKVYLYIYGANSHNENEISKASYSDRINWVKDNYEKIINLDKNLILSAENPFIFTAFCLNMKEIHNNPNAIIKTPVFLDATCSGIQHLAALMKDLELGGNTNLKPSKMVDKPEDFYSVLLEPINKKINQYGLNFPEFGILSQVKLNRKEIKTSIMTKVYNVTIYGISQQLQTIFKKVIETNNNKELVQDVFEKEFRQKPINEIKDDLIESFKSNKSKTKFICHAHDGKKIELSQRDIYKIATIINDEIFVRFPALNNIYNYFMDISNITSKLGIPLTWITPSGLKITQQYLKRKQKVITVSIFGKSKKLVLRENDTKLNEAKQKQAIIPNIVHSLDASHLINLINSAADVNFYPIITIHDCFGTLPNKMSELDFKVRKEFILIYTNGKFLKEFHNRFLQSISDNQYEFDDKDKPTCVKLDSKICLPIPSIPVLGDLDIENIKNSKYMIS